MRKSKARPASTIGLRDRLWDLSTDLMCVVDATGSILAANGAWTAILGWSEPELLSARLTDFIHPDDLETTRAELQRLDAGIATTRFENRYRAHDGGYRVISWRASPAEGLFYAIGRDITERLQREEALRQSQKLEAIGHLTGGIAHDFNNLLTIIRSSIDFIQRDDVPAPRKARYAQVISDTVDRAARLTGQLLAFARRQKLDPEVFEVGERIAEVSELLRQLVGPGIEIVTTAPPDGCRVEADVCQFETALMNLAINARDAMGGRGRLTIEAKAVGEVPEVRGHAAATGHFVAISVADTGPGIPPVELDRVFEPFFTTKEPGKGTGLGLSQVYGLVKQSGGNVDVQSLPGSGATFTIYLPRSPQPRQTPQAQKPQADAALGSGQCVLLVEDNEQVGAFCEELMIDLGYEVRWARSAAEALVKLDEPGAHFSIVFSDIVMPGMSGLELVEHVRETRPSLAVLLTSGYSPVLVDGRARGFPLLSKPYSAEELSKALSASLAIGPARGP
jgi:PAS domain S-box-containing protein